MTIKRLGLRIEGVRGMAVLLRSEFAKRDCYVVTVVNIHATLGCDESLPLDRINIARAADICQRVPCDCFAVVEKTTSASPIAAAHRLVDVLTGVSEQMSMPETTRRVRSAKSTLNELDEIEAPLQQAIAAAHAGVTLARYKFKIGAPPGSTSHGVTVSNGTQRNQISRSARQNRQF